MIVSYDQDEVGGGVLYVGGWDAAEDISGLQAAGVSAQLHKIFWIGLLLKQLNSKGS